MKSLFGDEIPDSPPAMRRREDRAHAARPGSGPEGETCRHCAHRCAVEHNTRVYQKCGLMRQHWTHGPGTDIRAKDPACKCFQRARETES